MQRSQSCGTLQWSSEVFAKARTRAWSRTRSPSSRPYGSSVWAFKPAGVVSCSPGALGGFGAHHHLRQSLVFLDMPCLQQPEMYLGHVNKAFDDRGKLTDNALRELLTKFITTFESWVDKYVTYVSPVERKSA